MSEINNTLLDAIDFQSDQQENITENEWNKINLDKKNILSKVSDTQKAKFISKYEELDKNLSLLNEKNQQI